VRALADAYRRAAQLKITVLKDEDLGSYYKHNIARFEQVELDRITVPRVNAKLAKEAQADFQKKADKLAADVRARIAAGEEPGTVQAEAYKALGLTPPLTTDLGLRRRGNLPPAIEDEIFSLKAGEVTKLQTDPVNVSMYKVRSRSIIPLAQAKAEIEQQMRQKRLQAELEEATGKREPQFNEKYFGTRTVSRTPAGGRNAAAQR
ncbi:MAG TPA: peptidylprolyl isomerase, partial [Terriglobales bacterium]|nr:peptidylprolyl isomerase [Terriglobales bacterium]